MSHRLDETMTDIQGIDMELYAALRVLDPGDTDSGYWTRFSDRVAGAATQELARRRFSASMTVGDVLVGWARTLVPTAMLAAAFAGVVLMRGQAVDTPQSLGIEEMLVSELQGLTIQQISSPDAPGNPILLAAELF
ncbi:MAG: hypothetical protein LC667_02970 [Thioalkalivibrio sp.]|nr:hypothetical protein [Thioalkalivibrio sp.]